jgi:hypothetical protein
MASQITKAFVHLSAVNQALRHTYCPLKPSLVVKTVFGRVSISPVRHCGRGEEATVDGENVHGMHGVAVVAGEDDGTRRGQHQLRYGETFQGERGWT